MFADRFPAYRALRPQHRRTRESIDAFRDARLRKVVLNAYEKVPFYRTLFDRHGIRPTDIRGASDLHIIPVTERSDIQGASMHDLMARGVNEKKLIERSTTGSTGACLVVKRTWMEEQVLNLFRWRAIRAYGLRRADVIGVPRVRVPTHPNDNQIPRRIANALNFYRKVIVDLRSTTDDVGALHARRPEVVMGWPTVLAEVAPRWKEFAAADPHPFDVRFVITGGEVCSPAARRDIRAGFNAPVRDMYGAHEFSLVACECPVTGAYHLSDETLYAEVLRDGKPVQPGESGEMIVTALHSFAMPFIRYRLGDDVVQGESTCGCGLPFSTIRSVRGRSADYLKLPKGKLVHPQDIAREAHMAAPWIRQLQVVQDQIGRFELLVVPHREPSAEEIVAIRTAVVFLLEPEVEFTVRIVSEISGRPDSKFRVYKSNIRR